MFVYSGGGLLDIYFNNFYAPNLKSTENMFKKVPIRHLKLDGIFEIIDVLKLENMKGMLMNLIYWYNLYNFTKSELTNMDNMFYECYHFINNTFKNITFYKSVLSIEMMKSSSYLRNITFLNINFYDSIFINNIIV